MPITLTGSSRCPNTHDISSLRGATASFSATFSETNVENGNNRSKVKVSYTVKFSNSTGYGFSGTSRPNAGTLIINVNGSDVVNVKVPINSGVHSGDTIVSGEAYSGYIAHEANGQKTVSISARIDQGSDQLNYGIYWYSSGTALNSLTLTHIPRYFSSLSASFKSQSLNTVTLNWNTSDNCSGVATNYGTIKSSTGIGGKSGTVTIGDLLYDTTYSIKLTCTRSDSGLTSTTNEVSVTTPHCPTINFSVSDLFETALTVNWKSDSTINYVWYSIDGGSTWTDVGSVSSTSGTFDITGLNAGSSYSIAIKIRSTDGVTNSVVQSVSTYAYPTATISDFIIGNLVSVNINNPLKRKVTVYLLSNGIEIATTYTTTETSVNGWNTEECIDQLYRTMVSATSAKYRVRVVYGSISNQSAEATIKVRDTILPNIDDIDFTELNETVDKYCKGAILRYLSQKKVTVTASSDTHALITNVSITLSDTTKQASLDDDGKYSATYNSLSNGKYTITVTDSRGRKRSVSGELEYYQYEYPTVSISASRESQTSSKGECNIEGKYWLNGLENTVHVYFDRASLATTELTGDMLYPSDEIYPNEEIFPKYYLDESIASGGNIKYTKTYSGSGEGDADKLLYNKSYVFTVRVVDLFGQEATATYILGLGHPTFYMGKDVSYFYDDVVINGEATIGGKSLLDWCYPKGTIIEMNGDKYDPNDIYEHSTWISMGNNKWYRKE